MLAVNHASFLMCLWLTVHSLKGIHQSIIEVNWLWTPSIFLLGDGSVSNWVQSCSCICLLSADRFLSLVSLDLITMGSFFEEINEFKTQTVGKWSLVSFMRMLLVYTPHKFWLTIMLSISVALVFVMWVGLVIVGIRPKSKLFWTKSFIAWCLSAFRKSRLWSSPIMMPFGFSFFIAHISEL